MRGDLLRTVFPEMRYLLRAGTKVNDIMETNPNVKFPDKLLILLLKLEFWGHKLKQRKAFMDEGFLNSLDSVEWALDSLQAHRRGEDTENIRRMLPTILDEWRNRI